MPSTYYYNLGRFYVKVGKSNEAIEQFKRAVKLDPKEIKYYFQIGFALSKLNEYKKALWYFNKITKLEKDFSQVVRAWCQKGIMEGLLGRHKDALKTFRKVLAKKPRCLRNCSSLYHNLGEAYSSLKRYKLAIMYYDKAIKIDPKDYRSWRDKGGCYATLGKHKESLMYFNKAIALAPKDRISLRYKSYALDEMGKSRLALRFADKVFRFSPDDDVALTDKGSILCGLGRHEEELLCYKKALNINPKNYVAWSNYGSELIRKGDISQGIKCIDRAMKINPKYVSEPVLHSKAFAFIKQRKYKLAIDSLSNVIKIGGKNAGDYYNLACLYSLVKNTDAAVKMLKKSVMLDKNYKVQAKKDPDFKNIETNKTFRRLVD